MIVVDDEDLEPRDASNAGMVVWSSPTASPAGDRAVRTHPDNHDSVSPKTVALSYRTRKRLQPVPAAIIDKSALFRAGLMHILAGSNFRVTAECSTLSDFPDEALGNSQSVALIGLDKDAETALPRIASLKQKLKGLRIIVLSEQLHPEQLFAAIEAGADGYLLRNEISPDAVLRSLELVLVEGVVVPQGFTKLLNNRIERPIHAVTEIKPLEPVVEGVQHEPQLDGEPPPPKDAAEPNGFHCRLSDREHLILMHLTQGASNKLIGRELNIAEATVKVHVKSLLRKIRVSNRTQAAMWAISHVGQIARQGPRRLN